MGSATRGPGELTGGNGGAGMMVEGAGQEFSFNRADQRGYCRRRRRFGLRDAGD